MKPLLVLLACSALLMLSAQDPLSSPAFDEAQLRIEAERDLALLRLGTQYRSALERGMDRAINLGNLDLFTALEAENKRFQEAPGIPNPVEAPDALLRIQETYLQQEIQILRKYYSGYLKAAGSLNLQLQQQEKKKVQDGDVEGAMALRTQREELSTSESVMDAQEFLANHAPEEAATRRINPVGLRPPSYLSDMEVSKHKVGYGSMGLGEEMGYENRKVRVDGEDVEHAISLHPPAKGKAFAEFELGKRYTQLEGKIGLNQSAVKRMQSPALFRVYGDGEELWVSEPFHNDEKAKAFKVNIRGVDVLRLEIQSTGANGSAHTVYIDPKVR